MGFFTSGEKAANRQRDLLGRKAQEQLSSTAIGGQFQGFQRQFNPIMAQMAQGAAVGANMDTQALQAGLARQGLGGTGLGAALGSGLRSGATFQTNQLRAKLLSDLFGAAVQTNVRKAGTFMQSAGMVQAEPSGFQQTMQVAQAGANLATLQNFNNPFTG
jgi:hypothetical protein